MREIAKRVVLSSLYTLGTVGRMLHLSRLSYKVTRNISPFPLLLRKLIDYSTPVDPLASTASVPKIELCIPCTEKDMALLPTVVLSAVMNSNNKIGSIRIVVPPMQVEAFQKYLGEDFDHLNLTVVSESALLGDLISLCSSVTPSSRRGWLIQQVVKFMCVLTSTEDGVLILDADTVITRPRTWLQDNHSQILMISEEFHDPYQHHFVKFQTSLKPELLARDNPRVSFVTHHQLMQPVFLREMFGGDSIWKLGLESWIKAVDFSSNSPACEYHCYGTFMVTKKPKQIYFARWGNVAVPRVDPRVSNQNFNLVTLQIEFPKSLSVSMHAYLS